MRVINKRHPDISIQLKGSVCEQDNKNGRGKITDREFNSGKEESVYIYVYIYVNNGGYQIALVFGL